MNVHDFINYRMEKTAAKKLDPKLDARLRKLISQPRQKAITFLGAKLPPVSKMKKVEAMPVKPMPQATPLIGNTGIPGLSKSQERARLIQLRKEKLMPKNRKKVKTLK